MKKQGIVIHPEELTDRMIELLKGTSINVLGLHPVGGRAADKSLENLLALAETEVFQTRLQKVRDLGIAIEYELHALSWLMPRSLFEEHPEWARINADGERVNDFNLCVSNEEAMEYLSSRAALLASKLKSDTGMYYFWSDDVPNTFCSCEKCRKFSSSDQALMIYNAILRGIRRVDKDAKQCYLAYQDTLEIPQTVTPDEGIFLEYAPIFRDTKVPLNDETSEKNQQFYKVIPPLVKFFGGKDAQVLEYWLDNSLFSNYTKPPKYVEICPDTIRRDIEFYRQQGFEGITTFGCYLSDDYIELHGNPPIKEYADCFINN